MMLLRLRCADCGADILVERVDDADGERLFGCCPCGLASVEHAALSEFAVSAPPRCDGVTDAAVLAAVASPSFA